MATEPSPTAGATRFIDCCLASPAAKTPGMPVSSGSGGRSRGHSRDAPREVYEDWIEEAL
jgi:hypothetical protein